MLHYIFTPRGDGIEVVDENTGFRKTFTRQELQEAIDAADRNIRAYEGTERAYPYLTAKGLYQSALSYLEHFQKIVKNGHLHSRDSQ